MSQKIDLSEPDFEPTDEQLQDLAKRAFEGVVELHQQALKVLRDEINEQRKKVLESLRSAK